MFVIIRGLACSMHNDRARNETTKRTERVAFSQDPRRLVMRTKRTVKVVPQENHRQLCVHALTGRAPEAKICAHNYECGTCPYDQMLDDVAEARIDGRLAELQTVRAA
jgi:hypothetical protein